MPARLAHLQPAFADVLPQVSEDVEAAVGLRDGGGEVRDGGLRDLHIRNLSRAIAEGGLGAGAQLGAAIGWALCEGQDGSHVR